MKEFNVEQPYQKFALYLENTDYGDGCEVYTATFRLIYDADVLPDDSSLEETHEITLTCKENDDGNGEDWLFSYDGSYPTIIEPTELEDILDNYLEDVCIRVYKE